MNNEQYIEHEVQIRVLNSELKLIQQNFNDKFASMQKNIDDRFAHVDYKINLLIGIAVVALLIPLVKSALGVL